jgi:hypothetical protein
MSKIQNIPKSKCEVDAVVECNDIIGDNEIIKIRIEPPRPNCPSTDEHSKWLLRVAPSESFDRWSVSEAISERFDNTAQISEFLSNTSDVYKMVLQRLSEDYKELEGRYMELEYGE